MGRSTIHDLGYDRLRVSDSARSLRIRLRLPAAPEVNGHE